MMNIASATVFAFPIADKIVSGRNAVVSLLSAWAPINRRVRTSNVMARPPRFPMKVEFWTTAEQVAALEALEQNSLLNKSDHLRQACAWYLQQMGVAPQRPARPNGGADRAPAEHVRA
jgi:hypothetical protein